MRDRGSSSLRLINLVKTGGHTNVYKESGAALIPFIIFIVLLVGSGIVLSLMGVERPFYQVPASVAVFGGDRHCLCYLQRNSR